jgi:hypothetical protein
MQGSPFLTIQDRSIHMGRHDNIILHSSIGLSREKN